MNTIIKIPFFARLAFGLLSIVLILTLLYVGRHIFIPILLSLLFAILLRPVVNFFNNKLKFPHVIAVTTAVTLFVLLIAGIIIFVSWQIGDIAGDWIQIKATLLVHYHNIQEWIEKTFHISFNQQKKYIQQATQDSLNEGTKLMGSTISSFTDALLNLVLIPIYTFLFLLYRNLFINFISKLFKSKDQNKLQEIFFQVKIVIQSFLVGLIIEMGVVATLTSIGLMIVGMQYAVLLGVITGLLNLIPYVGIFIAGLLTILATLTSSTDISTIVSVIIVNIVVQLIDNNILVPMIVSSKVKINAFVSIVGIIIGGAIAGIAGMFLAIPMIAIIKVIFDRIDSLEPWGFVMGDDLPKTYEWKKITFPAFNAGSPNYSQIPKSTISTTASEKDNSSSKKDNTIINPETDGAEHKN